MDSGATAPPFFTSALIKVNGQLNAPVDSLPGKGLPELIRRISGLHSQSGRYGEEKNLALPGIELGHSAHNQLLYRLSYPDFKARDTSLRITGFLDFVHCPIIRIKDDGQVQRTSDPNPLKST
jgi:hypothetical protein